MARRTKREAAQTRIRILDTALDVFSKQGYRHTSFVDIAKPLGLTKGAVYWHFKTKSDLLVALIENVVHHKRTLFDARMSKVESLDALRHCYLEDSRQTLKNSTLRKFEFFIQFQIEWSETLIADIRSGLGKTGDDPLRKYSNVIKRLQNAEIIDPTQDADELGSLLIAARMGLMRLRMGGILTEKELMARVEHQFDSLFQTITIKGD